MYIRQDCTPIQFFNIAHDKINEEYQHTVENYKSQLKSMDRIIASDHLKNFNEFVEDLKASNAYHSITMINDDQRGNFTGSVYCNLTSRDPGHDPGQYGLKPQVTVKVPFGLDGNKGFYLSGVTASSIRWIKTSVKFPKVYIDLKGDKYDYFVDALKFIGQVVRKYDDIYPDGQHWNMLFEDYSRDYRIPPEDDKERYPIYLSACYMQNKLKKYFEIHSLCKERVCK